LNGVITGPKKLRAIVTGPSGKTYFVMIGDHIGTRDGKISAIQPDFLKVVEYELDEKGKKIPEIFEVRLNGEMVSLSQKEE
jgi:Tfp pilus assembly protein PilP